MTLVSSILDNPIRVETPLKYIDQFSQFQKDDSYNVNIKCEYLLIGMIFHIYGSFITSTTLEIG